MTDRSHEARNAAATARLRALTAALADDEFGRETGDGWTVASGLVHMALWDRTVALRWSSALASGGLPVVIPLEIAGYINDASLPAWRAVPAPAAVAIALEAAQATDAAIAGLPDEVLEAVVQAGVPRVLDRSIHRNAHLDDIERALGRVAG